MSKRDHEPYVVDKFLGLHTRKEYPMPPQGYQAECVNCRFTSLPGGSTGGIGTREDFVNAFTLAVNQVQHWLYTKSTGTRIIYLDATGDFRDDTAGTVILHIVGATRFTGITINDRFYFTPHDGTLGVASEFVYVYDPSLSAVARKAAGVPATGVFTVAVSATAGNIEPGLHIVAISNVTDTGFITKPALHQTFTAPSGTRRMVDLTAIPLGPAGTVARRIWMSKVVRDYDGNIADPELFLVHTINDNVTTVLANTVNAFDSQLVSSADPYTDLLSEIPAGTFVNIIDSRLAVCGERANPDIVRVSNKAEPEAFDAVDGVVTVYRGYDPGVRTIRELDDSIYMWKNTSTYVMEPVDELPVNWKPRQIDTAIGSPVYGVGEVFNTFNSDAGHFVVANASGLYYFDGRYSTDIISDNIRNYWQSLVDSTNLKSIVCCVDPVAKRVYVSFDSVSIMTIFMFDYIYGLSSNTVRISEWKQFGINASEITSMHAIQSSTTGDTVILFGLNGYNKILKIEMNSSPAGADIDGTYDSWFTGLVRPQELTNLHVGDYNLLASGNNAANGALLQLNGDAATNKVLTLPTTDTRFMDRYNYNSEKISFRFQGTAAPFHVARLILYMAEVEKEMPG